MFKKRERLTTAEFEQYFKTGRRYNTAHATFITTPTQGKKISVVVGKKVSKRAVLRNKIRRRVYAQLRAELPTDYNGVCIVLVKPSFATLPRKSAQAFMTESIAALSKNT